MFDQDKKFGPRFSILHLLVYMIDGLHICITVLDARMRTKFFVTAKFLMHVN